MPHDDLSIITETLKDFWSQLVSRQITGVVVAYSGGLDSSVLLHLCRHAPVPVRAIHVHHGLQPLADAWQVHCEQTAKAWHIPLTCVCLDTRPQPGESIEAWARTQRYQALTAALKPAECLLTAHHEDDQAETLLIQLCRGAGIKGMAAMSVWRELSVSLERRVYQYRHVTCIDPGISIGNEASGGEGEGVYMKYITEPDNPRTTKLPVERRRVYLARPLLKLSQNQLSAYANAHALRYCDDPSNEDTRFLRNHIRHQVMPLLRKDFPNIHSHIARTAQHCAEAMDLLTELAYMDVPLLQAGPLDIRQLSSLSIPRQKNVLRTWLAIQGFDMPSSVHMQVLLQDVLQSRYDKTPVLTWANIEIRRYGYMLYALTSLSNVPAYWSASWDLQEDLLLPADLGYLSATSLRELVAYQPLTVRFRHDGETVRLLGHQHHKSLKNLMQQYRIPPWLRDRTPLLFHGEYLVAIVGYYQVLKNRVD